MNRKMTALGAAAAFGVAGLLVLSACAPTTPNEEPADPDNLPAVGWTEVDPSTLAQGGTLNLAVSSIPTDAGNWNPNTTEGAEVDPIAVEAPSTGQMIKLKADGSWEPDTNYAESVELVSEDPQTVEVKLNKDAVWEDGSALTATDYEATFAALSGKDSSRSASSRSSTTTPSRSPSTRSTPTGQPSSRSPRSPRTSRTTRPPGAWATSTSRCPRTARTSSPRSTTTRRP
jgi:peptide/nickel transport system substrate-binding protein